MRCRHDVCKFLVEAMHEAECGKIGRTAEDILLEVSKVLGFKDINAFLTVSGTWISSNKISTLDMKFIIRGVLMES